LRGHKRAWYPFRVIIGRSLALAALLLAAPACESGDTPRSARGGTPAPGVVAPPKVAQAAPPVPAAPAPAPEAPKPAGNAVEWRGDVSWHTWAEALPLARQQSKPIMVLVYADWCPHCRSLAPVFQDPEIEALAKRFVMVRQNHDDDPPWLEPYNKKYGAYVPRIFFFDSSGRMREDLTSGHPRYPFFYAAEHSQILKQTMHRAAGS
jgi:thiol:disulfide interchange protein